MTARVRSTGLELTLQRVTFAYGPHAEPVLRNLDLTVPAGDHLAVVGPSGIGKSTLAGLLCGLLRPDSGTVTIGDKVAAELPPERLAELRTLIPQEAYVFAGTVWDNLTYLCAAATTRQVDNAVAALGAKELVAKLGGIAAECSPAELSSGERQLVALVRAYLAAAPVVVLDEATCFLDPVAERRTEKAFAERPGTLIVIAHRISSALRARRILVLDGVSATVGDHRTLLSTSPLYRELLGHWHAAGSAAALSGDEFRDETTVNRLDLTIEEHMARTAEHVAELAPTPTPVAAGSGPSIPSTDGRSAARPEAMSSGAGPVRDPTAALTLWRRWARSRRPGPEPGGWDPLTESTATQPSSPHPTATEPTPPVAASGPAATDHQDRPLIFGQVAVRGDIPLAEATVTLTDLAGRQLDRDCSDSGGHYRLCPPTGGSYLVICASTAYQPTAALVAVADVPVRHDVVLSSAGASLFGTVSTAGTGQPVANAVATLVDVAGDVVGATTTEFDGRFAFFELAPGPYTLTVAASTMQPVARSVEVPSTGYVTQDVEVVDRVQLVGVVRTATSGVPVPEAMATLIASDGQVVGSVLTDARGEFAFDELDAGAYTVITTGYPPVATEVQLGGGAPTETVISLSPPTLGSPAEAVTDRSDPAHFAGYPNRVNSVASVQLGGDAR